MSIEDSLQKILLAYHCEKENSENSEEDNLKFLGNLLTVFIGEQLIKDGPSKESISTQYKKLIRIFHSDKLAGTLREIEHLLSRGKNNGICYQQLNSYYSMLDKADQRTPQSLSDFNNDWSIYCGTPDKFRQWLNKSRDNAPTYLGRTFYISLINLQDEIIKFQDETGRITPQGLRILVQSIPCFIVTFGAFLLAEELSVLYCLYFVLLTGGENLQKSARKELRLTGKAMERLGNAAASVTSTLISQFTRGTLIMSQQVVHQSINLGDSVARVFSSAPSEKTLNAHAEAPRGSNSLMHVLDILDAYTEQNQAQWFRWFRPALDKETVLGSIAFKIRVLIDKPIDNKIKLAEVEAMLNEAAQDELVYYNTAKSAIDAAKVMLNSLKIAAAVPAIEYKPCI